jgi:hypothetical protein
MSDEAPIAVIEKNVRECLRVAFSKFNGYDLLNVRVWVKDELGGLIPTKAGFALRITKIPDLIRALQQAETEARKRGLLTTEAQP